MSAHPLFDADSAGDLPDYSHNTGRFSDTDSLLANDGYSDTEEGDTHEDHDMDRSRVSSPTREEDNFTLETTTPGEGPLEVDEGPAHDFGLGIEHFLGQFENRFSALGDHPDFMGLASPLGIQSGESLENLLKRKRQEVMEMEEEFRSIKTKMGYHQMVYEQALLGIDGEDSNIPMDMFDEENRQRYLDEQEMYYDDSDIDSRLIPSLEEMDDAPPTAAEAALEEDGSPKDGENKKVDKGKGKAVDKGKGKARDKGKGKARVSPYDLTSGRTHREGDERIPRLGLSRSDWLSSILDRPLPFNPLFERHNELAQYGGAAYMGGHGYGGMSVAEGSGYGRMPIASGSGTHRDD